MVAVEILEPLVSILAQTIERIQQLDGLRGFEIELERNLLDEDVSVHRILGLKVGFKIVGRPNIEAVYIRECMHQTNCWRMSVLR